MSQVLDGSLPATVVLTDVADNSYVQVRIPSAARRARPCWRGAAPRCAQLCPLMRLLGAQDLYTPDEDPFLTVERYARSYDDDEYLGLNDMQTEGYETPAAAADAAADAGAGAGSVPAAADAASPSANGSADASGATVEQRAA